MAISNDWNINYITKQINHLQWKDEITGTDTSVAQISTVVCDTFANTAQSSYFYLYSATDATTYYVWFNKDAGGTDPSLTGKTAIPVAITTGMTAIQVAGATATAIDALSDFAAANSGTATVTITNSATGSATGPTVGGVSPGAGYIYAITTPGIGKTVWSTNALYSYVQDTFDELGQMDDMVPMSAQTPTEYSLINGWFIDEVSIKYLKGGAIKTIGWAGNVICQIGYNSGTHMVAGDIGKVIVGTTTADTGTILFFDDRTVDGDQGKLWIRPTSAAADLFNNGTEAYTITTGTGTGVFTSTSISGENTWANMYSIGTIESNTAIYIVQDGVKLTSWWPVGHVDVLIRVREIGSTTGENSGDLGQLFIGAREYTKLYDHFVSTGITGGRNPVPLATAADLNNTTGQYQTVVTTASAAIVAGETFTADANSNKQGTITSVTGTFPNLTIQYYLSGTALTAPVNADACTTSTGKTFTVVTPSSVVAGYTNIAMTFGDTSQNLNNGNGAKDYDVIIDCAGRSVAQMYEWLKFITRRGYTNSPQILEYGTGTTADTAINGEQYIDLLTSFTPVKASPFGTFAGGKFFGAQGVWITNYASTDAQNFQLIDATGTTQIPPNTVNVTVSAVVAGDRIGVFVLTAEAGTVKKDTYSSATSGNNTGDGDFVITGGTIDNETPQSGVLRVVQMGTATRVEQQYYYASWSSATFTLNSSTARGLSLAVTGAVGGSSTILTDTSATFQTWKVSVGDTITNTTDGSTATVVSVDSQTQITTTALTGGTGNTYENLDVFTFASFLTQTYVSGDKAYVPIINEVAVGTSVSNSLIKRKLVDGGANIPVMVRVRQGKIILPFEIETIIGDNGMSQAAIRTPDTIAT